MNEKIVLALLPHWSPLIPPMGMSCLKSYLEVRGFSVTLADANVEPRFEELVDLYYKRLKDFIPQERQGNLFNIGDAVLRRHMMAHFRSQDAESYAKLVEMIVASVFFTSLDSCQIASLQDVIEDFFQVLEVYVIGLLEKETPSVLGLSVYNSTLPASLFAFQLTRERFPHIKTVMGGGVFSGDLDVNSPNFHYFLDQTPYVDKIFVGEGEELFYQYLLGRLPLGKRVYSLEDLGGFTLDLDTSPVPDFSDFKLPFYPMIGSYTSRSCPFNCTFCSEKVMWGKFRKKKAQKIAEELSALSKQYNSQLFLMSDSLLNPVADDLAHALIAGNHSLYWDGYLRADRSVCDSDRTFRWRQGGFYRARLGLESGSPRVLAAMGKKIDPGQMKDVLVALSRVGIKTTTYWVIGYPGETEDDFLLTLDFIKEMKDEIYEADCNPFSYYLTGQVNSNNWAGSAANLLYPWETREMLLTQSWSLDIPPSREECYRRVARFVEFCRANLIPNPYSLHDIYKADERWKNLHPNSVPSLVDFLHRGQGSTHHIDENRHVQKIVSGNKVPVVDGDWEF